MSSRLRWRVSPQRRLRMRSVTGPETRWSRLRKASIGDMLRISTRTTVIGSSLDHQPSMNPRPRPIEPSSADRCVCPAVVHDDHAGERRRRIVGWSAVDRGGGRRTRDLLVERQLIVVESSQQSSQQLPRADADGPRSLECVRPRSLAAAEQLATVDRRSTTARHPARLDGWGTYITPRRHNRIAST